MRHVLTSMIGAREAATPELLEVEARPGDVFVLTTDGVHNVVDDETIGRLAALGTPDAAARRLVAEAIQRQTTDNVTAVVVRTS
jgi:serine/threonine protein phosphatase PrpC